MGSILSNVRLGYQSLKTIANDYDTIIKRISLSPGIPGWDIDFNKDSGPGNGTISYWTIPPSAIARHGADAQLPSEVLDVVIVGSGISGTAVAKTLMERDAQSRGERGGKHDEGELRVVMLEARDTCSGATGRNGGHISPNVYDDYSGLKKKHGALLALQILRFRLAHISALITVAEEEGILTESQARVVEEFDVFVQKSMFEDAKNELDAFLKEVREDMDKFQVLETQEDMERLQFSSRIIGAVSKPGAAIHPYRFVTGVLSNILSRHSNFQLFTHTPCTSIVPDTDGYYIVHTPRGPLKTLHVVHTTNAWASHLLPGLRRKIVPMRLHMSAQRPGQGIMPSQSLVFSDASPPTGDADSKAIISRETNRTEFWAGKRAFVFYPGKSKFAFDWLTQQLPASSSPPIDAYSTSGKYGPTHGEFMLGGGAMLGGRADAVLFDNFGVADDNREPDIEVNAYLGGILPCYFSNWGPEGHDSDVGAAPEDTSAPDGGVAQVHWEQGRVKAIWTGIMGISADIEPWVGRIPSTVSGRREVAASTVHRKDSMLVSPGEWIAAGYSGEGMGNAWLCGVELVRMMMELNLVVGGHEADSGKTQNPSLPSSFLITEKRWKNAKIEELMEGLAG